MACGSCDNSAAVTSAGGGDSTYGEIDYGGILAWIRERWLILLLVFFAGYIIGRK